MAVVRAKSRGVVRRDERGAGLVEFALLLPLVMMLILGMITGGQAYTKDNNITGATREGARYGATLDRATAAWASKVRDVVVERSSGDLTAGKVCVALVDGAGASLTVVHSTNSPASPCTGANDTGAADHLRVQVSATTPAKIDALLFTWDLDLKAGAVAKYEGE